MSSKQPYAGYILSPEPVERDGVFTPRVVIEWHEHGSDHFQEVADDPAVRFAALEDAERASINFGMALIDSWIREGGGRH